MSTATDNETVSLAELEEHFALEVPCGGNISPVKRPCPDQAAAIMISSHRCPPLDPQDFKCLLCYTEWLTGRKGAEFCRCYVCDTRIPILKAYVPL